MFIDFKKEFGRSEKTSLSPTVDLDWTNFGILREDRVIDPAQKKTVSFAKDAHNVVADGLSGHARASGDWRVPAL